VIDYIANFIIVDEERCSFYSYIYSEWTYKCKSWSRLCIQL